MRFKAFGKGEENKVVAFEKVQNVAGASLHGKTIIAGVGTRKHQKIWIDRFKCLIRVFPGDLSIVQGFCEV